jgi:hypothetical protein
MNAAKCIISVTAGVVLNQPVPEYSRQYSYTSADYEADKVLTNEPSRLTSITIDAYDYARRISKPNKVNWVNVKWIWL